jgi:drug/metabolite transporter (DMT)-like permease
MLDSRIRPTKLVFLFINTSAVHVLISGLGAAISIYIFNSCQLNTLRKEQVPIWLGFSFLYTMNIAVSNVALERVSLPFHQIIRSTNPVVTSILEYFIFRRLYSEKTYLSLIPVININCPFLKDIISASALLCPFSCGR